MSEILTSLHGKQVGIDKDGYLTSPVGIKVPSVFTGVSGSELNPAAVTSASTAASISGSGLTWFSSAAGAFTLTDPLSAGQTKVLSMDNAPATTTWSVTTAAAGIGNANKTIWRTTGAGPIALTLQAISTALWAIRASHGSPAVSTA